MIYGIGTDMVRIKRMADNLDRFGERFAHRILTESEMSIFVQSATQAQFLSKRFAAKEAVFKAIGNKPDIRWKDLEISNDEHGKPTCVFHDTSFDKNILISISHSKNYAVANAIISS